MAGDFVISRVFDAPRDLVWRCFTDPERMKQWWGPKGFNVLASKMDLRVGGTYHYGMKAPDGGSHVGQVRLPRNRPARRGWSSSIRFPTRRAASRAIRGNATWPLEMLSTFTFEDAPGGKTKFTVRWVTAQRQRRRAQDLRRRPRQHDARLERHHGAARGLSRRKRSSHAQGSSIMPIAKQKITPCLWFDTQAEEAAKFYCVDLQRLQDWPDQPLHRGRAGCSSQAAGSVMVVEFEIDGQTFTAFNGGPNFKFSEAISLQVRCETQDEIDYFWDKLTQGGQEGPCGWLKDKFGLSWQVVPAVIPKMMTDPDPAKSERVMNAFMKMKKLDLRTIDARSTPGENNERHRKNSAIWRSERNSYSRVRRAARAGVAGLDRSENDGAVVRAARLYQSGVASLTCASAAALRIVMHGPDGNDYPMKGVFREVVTPERLVFTNIAIDNDGNHLLEGVTTVTFAEQDGKTTLTLHTHAVGLRPDRAGRCSPAWKRAGPKASINWKNFWRGPASSHYRSIQTILASNSAIIHSATAVQRLRRASAAPIAATVSGDSTRPSRVMSST